MRNLCAATVIVTLMTFSGCAEESDGPSSEEQNSVADQASADATAAEDANPTRPSVTDGGPEYAALSEADLEGTLLTVQEMPVGYSQDPPSEATDKTFCDYDEPFVEDFYVSRDFTKGGGISTQIVSVGLRQYESPAQSRAAFEAMSAALSTCTSEVFQGTTLNYAIMSAPAVGDDSIGVRITADDMTLLQNFVLVGPTLVSTGGGGLIESDADEIAGLVEAQVESYEDTANP